MTGPHTADDDDVEAPPFVPGSHPDDVPLDVSPPRATAGTQPLPDDETGRAPAPGSWRP